MNSAPIYTLLSKIHSTLVELLTVLSRGGIWMVSGTVVVMVANECNNSLGWSGRKGVVVHGYKLGVPSCTQLCLPPQLYIPVLTMSVHTIRFQKTGSLGQNQEGRVTRVTPLTQKLRVSGPHFSSLPETTARVCKVRQSEIRSGSHGVYRVAW